MKDKFPPFRFRLDIFVCCLHPYTKQNNKIFVQMFRCAVALWKSWICKYSIRFQVIKLKFLCETLKNEKFLLDIQTKCGDIVNEILNAVIDAERTFQCKWPMVYLSRPYPFKSLKAVFRKFHLVHSWIVCPMLCFLISSRKIEIKIVALWNVIMKSIWWDLVKLAIIYNIGMKNNIL